jgi:hypothetical protein
MKKALPVGPRPVYNEGLSDHRSERHESPVSAIIAVVPVVSHDKEMAFGHDNRAEMGVGLVRRRVHTMFVIEFLAVYIDGPSYHFNAVTRESDDPFDEILAWIHRIDENDNIIPFGFFNGNQRLSDERDFDSIDKFVHQYMVSHQKGRFHGSGGDLERLYNKSPYEESKDNRDNCSLYVFSEYALFLQVVLAGSAFQEDPPSGS